MYANEQIEVLGRTADNDLLLVRLNSSATGWVRSSDLLLLQRGACTSREVLDVYDVDQFRSVFWTPQELSRVSSMQIENRPVTDTEGLSCTLDGYPPSGLLIFNPSGTPVELSVNGLGDPARRPRRSCPNMAMYSASSYSEGNVTVRVPGGGSGVSASAGRTILVNRVNNRPSGRPYLARPQDTVASTIKSCRHLEKLARAAFSSRGRLSVPRQRLDFCRYMPPAGYVPAPTLVSERLKRPQRPPQNDRPQDDVQIDRTPRAPGTVNQQDVPQGRRQGIIDLIPQ